MNKVCLLTILFGTCFTVSFLKLEIREFNETVPQIQYPNHRITEGSGSGLFCPWPQRIAGWRVIQAEKLHALPSAEKIFEITVPLQV